MEKSVIKYLSEFSEKLDHRYGDDIDMGRLFWDADKDKLNIKEDYSWLTDFSVAIDNIYRLLANQHIHVKHVKEIGKTETASRVDAEAFNMTLKEPKLWREVNGVAVPHSVYYNTFEDEYAIYENRFIKQLIDEMSRYLADSLTEISSSLGNLRSFFASGLTEAGALRLSQEKYRSKSDDETRVLADLDDPVVARYEQTEYLLKRITRCKNSVLYIECAKKPPLKGYIQPTNILLQDPVYSVCYRFYEKLCRMGYKGRNIRDALCDNGMLRLLYAFHRNGYRLLKDGKIARGFYGGRRYCRNLCLQSDDFSVRINTCGESEMLFEVAMRENGADLTDEKYISRVTVLFSDCAADEAEAKAAEYRALKFSEGYDDAFLVVFSRQPIEFDGVVNLANKGDFSGRAVEDFVRSLTLQLNGAHVVFAKRCPVCGGKYVSREGDKFICGSCGGKWSLVNKGETEIVWLRHIKH